MQGSLADARARQGLVDRLERLSPEAKWYVLGYRHMDHHFRQFGV